MYGSDLRYRPDRRNQHAALLYFVDVNTLFTAVEHSVQTCRLPLCMHANKYRVNEFPHVQCVEVWFIRCTEGEIARY